MRAYVVADEPINSALLKNLLGRESPPGKVEVFQGEGRSSALSIARTLLATDRWPVAFVVDADTTHERLIDEQKALLEEALGQAGARERFGVFLAVPALVSCFFLDEAGMRKLFGAELTSERLIRARFEPMKVLDELLHTKRTPRHAAAIVALTSSLDGDRLRQLPALQSLLTFLRNALQATAVRTQ